MTGGRGIRPPGWKEGDMSEEKRRFTVRKFERERDLDAVCRCFVDSFYHNSWPFIDQTERRFMEETMLDLVDYSQVAIVAEADGEARGFLVGYFPREGLTELRALWSWVRLLLRVVFRRYRMTMFARAAFYREVRGDLSYILRDIGSPAEVQLLCSQKEYRGGIGRDLMDAWVDEVRARGLTRTTLGSDSTMSWGFYERYGFRKVKEFTTGMYFYSMPGVDVRAYIYSMEVPPA